ncbi:MAG: YbaK/EbsC family protein, partial [Chloroflexi bacterium]|nr:YbaK/EbsC family protein [Chloroflexota bacterium]
MIRKANILALSTSCQKVQNYLDRFNLKLEIQELAKSTRTAQEAADDVGCAVGQIVKSLIFRTGDQPLLFLVSGKNQLDVNKVNAA